ncbi:hypothetical protein SAMN05216474_0059 [Lishizhenia tianjinensis]|uniref:Uncharacterized protein n=1 Tax=Lishizhenia tianjinensis TaxID=477690 RepID=A0A1I6XAY8_9FLAO|nr:hypothetical protein [Lishizhenia tianjinensis]SFT35397.1 hypothetical protein SAMN05216474_0059 [Lishizhenia tianjinensis]
MKTTILILLLFGTFYSCEKTNKNIHEVKMSDTLEAQYMNGVYDLDYTLDVFNNKANVIEFDLHNSLGSSGSSAYTKINGTGDIQIAYEIVHDTSWHYAFEDTVWNYSSFNEASYYLPNSGIPGPLNFSSDKIIMTNYYNPGTMGPPSQSDNYEYSIINSGHVYLLAKNSNDVYIRVEVEVLGTSKLVIHGYGYSDDLNELFE